ncbi:MAG: DUF1801 domain-containing protein [Actinomycetota bacterium]|nr:DUF1801 domain-containing protein [Actinomycetota bacterium]
MRDQTGEGDRFLRSLDLPLKEEIVEVRDIILGADKEITEHITWNAASFCYQGQDRVTFKPHPQDRIHLIFHRGAKVRYADDFNFGDGSGLMRTLVRDRAMVSLSDVSDVDAQKGALRKLVREWMKATASQ